MENKKTILLVDDEVKISKIAIKSNGLPQLAWTMCLMD